jgi:hypothetical protein
VISATEFKAAVQSGSPMSIQGCFPQVCSGWLCYDYCMSGRVNNGLTSLCFGAVGCGLGLLLTLMLWDPDSIPWTANLVGGPLFVGVLLIVPSLLLVRHGLKCRARENLSDVGKEAHSRVNVRKLVSFFAITGLLAILTSFLVTCGGWGCGRDPMTEILLLGGMFWIALMVLGVIVSGLLYGRRSGETRRPG